MVGRRKSRDGSDTLSTLLHRLSRRSLLGSSMLGLIASAPVHALSAGGPKAGQSYRDPAAPIAARVQDLLSRMTLEEKAAQLRSIWLGKAAMNGPDAVFAPEKAAKVIPQGIGTIARGSEGAYQKYRPLAEIAGYINALQRFLTEQTRLGIPALIHDELAHGLLANDATNFPSPPALASTWDLGLVEQVFTVAAREARLRGTTLALTPVLDLARDPRYGRVEEFFGEDPYLVGAIATAAVQGLQGRQRPLGPDRVFATLKHFVHAVPQGGLNTAPADIGERALRESFLPPFAEVIRKADPAAIMPSYNEIGGVPSHANVDLLQKTGRRLLGFKGIYISDYEGIGNLKDQHHVAATKEEAAVLALNAGVQADLPEGACYAHLPELVRAGRVSELQVDAAVAKMLALKFEAGLFENPYVDAEKLIARTMTAADVALARKAAQRSLVLLKNEGIVPLCLKPGMRLAVIGPNGAEAMTGGYSGTNTKGVSVLEGIRRAVPAGVVVEHAEGVWITPPDKEGLHLSFSPIAPVPAADDEARIAAAVELAKRADVVLLVLGDAPAVAREAVHISLPGDRSTLGLWGRQDALVEALAATGTPLVSLLLNGRPLTVTRLAEVSRALFEGWYMGQEGGNAFADVLFGKVAPGGKLAVSFPRSVGELPVYYDRHPSADSNTYLEGPRTALFPFGHGLSYTTFDISAPRLPVGPVATGEPIPVEVDLTNTGKVKGDEVVQLYLRDEVSSVPRPIRELKAFQRVTLAPGERRTLHFTLTPDDLALWDIDMKWAVEPGEFTISAGSSSAMLKHTLLTLAGDTFFPTRRFAGAA